ncbi:MAG: P-loop NTPase [candidate division KSB1 bacterium]|nr:P-loop NTPase [candidate division KSB1 bacterium]MDZ7272632.1 P-loop NTPase [candidate division KSB1 bacterium]MDZ7284346.1 P-loop NTPase [candidate division KSB1 bacterium]MDZ7297258.1 P-loop NTPase [candidate division KSB1 bacterium]MDZ7307566.1 P-loop NTPase [candidate division KSB1 bacterium]
MPLSPPETNPVSEHHRASSHRPLRIITVAGGKGGVGKTVVSASLALVLQQLQASVVLVDADLGGANLHTLMGIDLPARTLHDFISRHCRNLADILLDSPLPGVQLICGAAGSAGFANLEYNEKLKIIRHLRQLPADFVIVDIGAGSSFNEVDLFNAGDVQIVVATPEPTSIQECYNFLKVAVFRLLRRSFQDSPKVLALLDRSRDPTHLQDQRLLTAIGRSLREHSVRDALRFFRIINALSPKLILNCVHDYREIREGLSLQIATQDLLRLRLEFWGYLNDDSRLQRAVRLRRPEELLPAQSENHGRFRRMVQRHLLGAPAKYQSRGVRAILPLLDLQDKPEDGSRICSIECLLWGRCDLQEGGLPCRMPEHMFQERITQLTQGLSPSQ